MAFDATGRPRPSFGEGKRRRRLVRTRCRRSNHGDRKDVVPDCSRLDFASPCVNASRRTPRCRCARTAPVRRSQLHTVRQRRRAENHVQRAGQRSRRCGERRRARAHRRRFRGLVALSGEQPAHHRRRRQRSMGGTGLSRGCPVRHFRRGCSRFHRRLGESRVARCHRARAAASDRLARPSGRWRRRA